MASRFLAAVRIYGDDVDTGFDVHLNDKPKIGQVISAADGQGRVRRLCVSSIHIKNVLGWRTLGPVAAVEIGCTDVDCSNDV